MCLGEIRVWTYVGSIPVVEIWGTTCFGSARSFMVKLVWTQFGSIPKQICICFGHGPADLFSYRASKKTNKLHATVIQIKEIAMCALEIMPKEKTTMYCMQKSSVHAYAIRRKYCQLPGNFRHKINHHFHVKYFKQKKDQTHCMVHLQTNPFATKGCILVYCMASTCLHVIKYPSILPPACMCAIVCLGNCTKYNMMPSQ